MCGCSGAWQGEPAWGRAVGALRSMGVREFVLLVLLSVALSVVLHPLQFTMVQILEGYWGAGRLAQSLRTIRIAHHLKRRDTLSELGTSSPAGQDPSTRDGEAEDVRQASLRHEADRLFRQYPDRPELVMPTRLGNMLRRYEAGPGRPYGMDVPTVTPLLAVVAPPEHMAYVDDQRSALDLAVRTCLVSLLATGLSITYLWDNGLWLLLALIPYGAGYLAYRGAVVCAEHYGIALMTLLALNRFALYDRLGVPRPRDTSEEAALNAQLGDMLADFEPPAKPLRFVRSPF